VWVKSVMKLSASHVGCGFSGVCAFAETGVISRWLLHTNESVFSTHTDSVVFVLWKRCAAFLTTPRHASSLSFGAQKKPLCGECGRAHSGWYDRKRRRVRDLSCGDRRAYLEIEVRRVQCRRCGKMKRERLDFLADNPLYTKRFA